MVVDPEASGIALGQYSGKGFFPKSSFFVHGAYADTDELDAMINDQVNVKLKEYCGQYFEMSWTLTQTTNDALKCAAQGTLPSWLWWIASKFTDMGYPSILDLAGDANAALYGNTTLLPACGPTCFPNILTIDDVTPGVGVVEMALKIIDKANPSAMA